MNPAAIIALMATIQTLIKSYMDLTGKDVLTKDDFATKSPKELLKEMGIDLDTI